ncbi:hypothetical protein HZC53_02445 [Candidatus Uhrbacteria bacterium]|nr:hypothetical protein [Candidatus Uhrbacteria bacterium]
MGTPKIFDPHASADGRTTVSLDGPRIKIVADGVERTFPVPENCSEPPAEADKNVWLKTDRGVVYGEYCYADSATVIARFDAQGKPIGSKSFPGGIGLDISPASGKAVFYVGSTEDYAFVVAGLDGSDPTVILQYPNPGEGSKVPLTPGIMRFSASGTKLFYSYQILEPIDPMEPDPGYEYAYHSAIYDVASGSSRFMDEVFPAGSETFFYGWIGDSILVTKDKSGIATQHRIP